MFFLIISSLDAVFLLKERRGEAKRGHGKRKWDPGGAKKVVQGGMRLSAGAASLRARATGKGREGEI